MKFFLDTEFVEGTQKSFFGNTKPTIDLISIGIVGEDGSEYYAVSSDFNMKEAWNRYQLEKDETVGARIMALPPYKKVYWLRENVLMPIFFDLAMTDFHNTHFKDEWMYERKPVDLEVFRKVWGNDFKWFRKLIVKYGKSNLTIATEVERFVRRNHYGKNLEPEIRFYGYFADYDWLAFCWLFGRMNDLPKGFPMYCIDLKQMLDELVTELNPARNTFEEQLEVVRAMHGYPKQINEHSALADARWNKELFDFLLQSHKPKHIGWVYQQPSDVKVKA